MKLCFPVRYVESLESKVYGHFGSAPAFIVVDTVTKEIKALTNPDQTHVKGRCNPIETVAGQNVEGIVVAGIGKGALMKLNKAGIKVYKGTGETVGENISLFNSGMLPEFRPEQVCAGHGHGCAH